MKLHEVTGNTLEEILNEVDRRDFLKGLGAAAGLSAVGKSFLDNDPQLFEPGIYKGKAQLLRGGWSSDNSGDGWGENGGVVNLNIIITKDKILIDLLDWVKPTKNTALQTRNTTMEFNQIKISGNTLTASKTLSKIYTYTLTLNKDGTFNARKISEDPRAEKNYRYHTWGYDGKVNPEGSKSK